MSERDAESGDATMVTLYQQAVSESDPRKCCERLLAVARERINITRCSHTSDLLSLFAYMNYIYLRAYRCYVPGEGLEVSSGASALSDTSATAPAKVPEISRADASRFLLQLRADKTTKAIVYRTVGVSSKSETVCFVLKQCDVRCAD
jgi:hypothetical protein